MSISGTYGLGTPRGRGTVGIGGGGLTGIASTEGQQATAGIGELAQQEQRRNQFNETQEAQTRQGNASLGATAGATYGATFGPWGALAGAFIGGAGGYLF